jgi:hypothetical protein
MSLPKRFSLRTLFLLVAMAGVLIAWITADLRWIHERHNAKVHVGEPIIVGYSVARETLHERSSDLLPISLRLLGETAVPVLTRHPLDMRVDDLHRLFPEADIIEIWYPTYPDTVNSRD